uniref:DUF2274 domain-containing protein n=1 Tax=Bosea sp. NBC_00436 TaxID=2969620 RepID=A0A9E8CP66_9HYPH
MPLSFAADLPPFLFDLAAPFVPAKLIVPMLERFIATNRGFAKTRRQERSGTVA